MNVAELLSAEEKAGLVELRDMRTKALAGLGDAYLEYEKAGVSYTAARQRLDVAKAGVLDIGDRISSRVEQALEGKDVPPGATLDINDLESP